ncbi:MAG: TIGR02300 family protein [Alphaproteobacteria bacterium]|nr:TIGR02300 family protein [Alphaproteobacteria bacterium]
MAKSKWGTKRLCPSCGVRFYDMKRNPVSCPSCNADVSIEPLLKPRKHAPPKEALAPAKVEPKIEVETPVEDAEEIPGDLADIADVDDIEDDDDDDDALIEDTSDLEEEDDIPEIKEHTVADLNTDG